MSKHLQIQIPQPCTENWDAMTPEGKGRHCASCQKIVVDFSVMIDQQVLDYLKGAAGRHLCGRFAGDQLNREIRPVEDKIRRSGGFWQWMVASLLVFTRAEAQVQTKPPVGDISQVLKNGMPVCGLKKDTITTMLGGVTYGIPIGRPSSYLEGRVLEQGTDRPVGYATVHIKGSSFTVTTDSAGLFRIRKSKLKPSGILEMSCVGYRSKEVPADAAMCRQEAWVFRLEHEYATLPSVTVEEPMSNRRRMGLMVCITSITTYSEREKPVITNTESDIRLFPDPAPRGAIVNWSLPAAGHGTSGIRFQGPCRIEIFNSAGALLQTQSLELAQGMTSQVLNLPPNLPGGIYFVHFFMNGSRKSLTKKLVIY